VQYAAPLRRPVFHSGEVEYVVDTADIEGFGDSGIGVEDIGGSIWGVWVGDVSGSAAQVEDFRDTPQVSAIPYLEPRGVSEEEEAAVCAWVSVVSWL